MDMENIIIKIREEIVNKAASQKMTVAEFYEFLAAIEVMLHQEDKYMANKLRFVSGSDAR